MLLRLLLSEFQLECPSDLHSVCVFIGAMDMSILPSSGFKKMIIVSDFLSILAFNFVIFLFNLTVHAHMCVHVHAKLRGQLCGMYLLCPPLLGLDSDHQACMPSSLLTELSHQPSFEIFF